MKMKIIIIIIKKRYTKNHDLILIEAPFESINALGQS